MGLPNILTLALSVSFIMGCSPGKSPDPAPPPVKTVFEPLTQQVDRAKAVQQTVDQNTDSTRKAVEAQERGDSPP